jgi:DNA modification methylase
MLKSIVNSKTTGRKLKDKKASAQEATNEHQRTLPRTITMSSELFRKHLPIDHVRTCSHPPNNLNCMTAKEWLKSQLGVWQFYYEGRDIRNKVLHPATFPISLAKKVIELFTHEGELVLDPFVGAGTVLVAAQDVNRNAVGFDLQEGYIRLCEARLQSNNFFNKAQQVAVHDDARSIPCYLMPESVGLIWTSPPYANLLNRSRKNKSRRDRDNGQLGKVEQYSQDPRDLGTKSIEEYTQEMGLIYEALLPLLRPKGHCVINVPDMWWENQRITIHVALIEELRRRGYELRNVIIWDRTNIVNRIGIFGWPSNYITMGVTFEYLLDFWRPPVHAAPVAILAEPEPENQKAAEPAKRRSTSKKVPRENLQQRNTHRGTTRDSK